MDHSFSNDGICGRCGCSQDAVGAFGWACRGSGASVPSVAGGDLSSVRDGSINGGSTAPRWLERENVFYRGRSAGHAASTPSTRKDPIENSASSDSGHRQLMIDDFSPLLALATPNVYRRNAFRVLGLSADASAQVIRRQFNKLEVTSRFGGAPEVRTPMPLDPPPDLDASREAAQQLRDPETRLLHELFWFSPIGDGGLTAENLETSVRSWAADSAGDPVAQAHNLAIYHHATAIDLELAAGDRPVSREHRAELERHWREAFASWQYLIALEAYWSALNARARELDDPRLTAGIMRRIRATLPLAVMTVSAKLGVAAGERGRFETAARLVRGMVASPFEPRIIETALRESLGPARGRFESLLKAQVAESEKTPGQGATIARQLPRQAQTTLELFDIAFGVGNPTRDAIYDALVNRAMDCQIIYSNDTHDWTTALEFYDSIEPYVASDTVRKRLIKERETAKGNVEFAEEEKLATICWFCQSRNGEADRIEVQMYGDVVETSYNIKWRHTKVHVPRCSECKAAHEARAHQVTGTVIMAALIAVGGAFLGFVSESGPVFVAVATLAVLFGLYREATDARAFRVLGIKREAEKHEHPRITSLKDKGWKFGDRPPVPQG